MLSIKRSQLTRRSALLLANERVVHASSISSRPGNTSGLLPSFLQPAPKRRQLILTDFPRLIEVKDEKDEADKGARVKFEAVFVRQPTGNAEPTAPTGSGGANRVVDVQEKGTKGFTVNTVSTVSGDWAELTRRSPSVCNTLRTRRNQGITGCRR